MIAGVGEGKLQLAFTAHPGTRALRGLRFDELARDPICLAVTPGHPLARRRTVTTAAAAREPLVAYNRTEYPEAHELVSTLFSDIDVRRRIVEEHDSVSALIAAVEAGAGVAVVVESLACTAGARLKLLPFSPSPNPLRVGAVWSDANISAEAKRFLEVAKETCSPSK
jgi:DNA-binding transcriptional LysR family regulator